MMDIFVHNWTYEFGIRYLKTGLTGIAREEIDILENYVLANGIGNQWTREEDWDYRPDSGFYTGDMTEQEYSIIDRVNRTRRNHKAPYGFSKENQGTYPVQVMCSAVYELLCELGIPELIEERIDDLREAGLPKPANEYGQIWNIVMEVLDQMVEAMGRKYGDREIPKFCP